MNNDELLARYDEYGIEIGSGNAEKFNELRRDCFITERCSDWWCATRWKAAVAASSSSSCGATARIRFSFALAVRVSNRCPMLRFATRAVRNVKRSAPSFTADAENSPTFSCQRSWIVGTIANPTENRTRHWTFVPVTVAIRITADGVLRGPQGRRSWSAHETDHGAAAHGGTGCRSAVRRVRNVDISNVRCCDSPESPYSWSTVDGNIANHRSLIIVSENRPIMCYRTRSITILHTSILWFNHQRSDTAEWNVGSGSQAVRRNHLLEEAQDEWL